MAATITKPGAVYTNCIRVTVLELLVLFQKGFIFVHTELWHKILGKTYFVK